ncbi:hypothetical protein PAK19_09575, partial [Campylobacter coli]
HLARMQDMDGARLGEFIASADPVVYMRCLRTVDPTGDTAARNVDRERREVVAGTSRTWKNAAPTPWERRPIQPTRPPPASLSL